MSNNVAVSYRNESQVHSPTPSRLRIFLDRIRRFCICFRKQEDHALPLVHAVDSVRLVYMRRIEEASMLNFMRQQHPEGVNEETQTRMIRHRRLSQKISTIQALEKALREYELKHKNIISYTRVPESLAFDKSIQISRGSQTDTAEVIAELLKAVNDVKNKDLVTHHNSEVVKRVTLYSMDMDDDNSMKPNSTNIEIHSAPLNGAIESSKTTLQTV